MAYDGEIMNQCLVGAFDFSLTYAIVVSGSMMNPCGHLMLNTGGITGMYFHVAGVVARPRYMNASGYQRYLTDNGKRELSRTRVVLSKPMAAQRKLETLLSEWWIWLVLPNNCAHFVEEVVQAGGSTAGLYFNCPSREAFE